MHMSAEWIQKKLLQLKSRGKRPRGRPRTRWIDQVRKDIEDRGIIWTEIRTLLFVKISAPRRRHLTEMKCIPQIRYLAIDKLLELQNCKWSVSMWFQYGVKPPCAAVIVQAYFLVGEFKTSHDFWISDFGKRKLSYIRVNTNKNEGVTEWHLPKTDETAVRPVGERR